MQKAILTILTFFSLFFASNAYGQYSFNLNVMVTSELKGSTFTLLIDSNESFVKHPEQVDSALVLDNELHFQGVLRDSVSKARLNVKWKDKIYKREFVLETGHNIISIDFIDEVSDTISLSAPGSISNKIFNGVMKTYYKYYATRRVALGEYKGPVMLPEEEMLAAHLEIFEFLKKNRNSFYSLIALKDIEGLGDMIGRDSLILDVLNCFNPAIRENRIAKKIFFERTANVQRSTLFRIGKKIPSFKAKFYNVTEFDNETLLGKPYLVVFSATWCLPCQEEQEDIHILFNKYKSFGFKVVYLNLDDNRDKWLKQVKSGTFAWINVSDGAKFRNSPIAKQFMVSSIPSGVLVDEKGIMTYLALNKDLDFGKLYNLLDKIVGLN